MKIRPMETEKLLIITTFHTIVSEYSHFFFYSCMRVKFTLRLNEQEVIKVFIVICSIWIVKKILSDDVTFTNISVIQGLLENQIQASFCFVLCVSFFPLQKYWCRVF